MRIISKFHDYYDGVAYSPEPVYNRKTSEVSLDVDNFCKHDLEILKDIPMFNYHIRGGIKDRTLHSKYLFGICGKVYPVYQVSFKGQLRSYQTIKEASGDGQLLLETMWFNRREDPDIMMQDYLKIHQRFFEDLFYKFKVPLYIISRDFIIGRGVVFQVILNPSLRGLKLAPLFPPWQTYQDIERFIGNDLVEDKLGTFKISDELKRDSKGFDKNSFKRRKL